MNIDSETFYIKEPIHVCKCGEFIYSREELYLITLKGKVLDERYKTVCKKCYLKHKETEKESNIIDIYERR